MRTNRTWPTTRATRTPLIIPEHRGKSKPWASRLMAAVQRFRRRPRTAEGARRGGGGAGLPTPPKQPTAGLPSGAEQRDLRSEPVRGRETRTQEDAEPRDPRSEPVRVGRPAHKEGGETFGRSRCGVGRLAHNGRAGRPSEPVRGRETRAQREISSFHVGLDYAFDRLEAYPTFRAYRSNWASAQLPWSPLMPSPPSSVRSSSSLAAGEVDFHRLGGRGLGHGAAVEDPLSVQPDFEDDPAVVGMLVAADGGPEGLEAAAVQVVHDPAVGVRAQSAARTCWPATSSGFSHTLCLRCSVPQSCVHFVRRRLRPASTPLRPPASGCRTRTTSAGRMVRICRCGLHADRQRQRIGRGRRQRLGELQVPASASPTDARPTATSRPRRGRRCRPPCAGLQLHGDFAGGPPATSNSNQVQVCLPWVCESAFGGRTARTSTAWPSDGAVQFSAARGQPSGSHSTSTRARPSGGTRARALARDLPRRAPDTDGDKLAAFHAARAGFAADGTASRRLAPLESVSRRTVACCNAGPPVTVISATGPARPQISHVKRSPLAGHLAARGRPAAAARAARPARSRSSNTSYACSSRSSVSP